MRDGDVHLLGCGPAAPVPPREVVGSKALGLFRMAAAGLAVPPGVVFGTELCREFHAAAGRLPKGFSEELAMRLRVLERTTRRSLGSGRRPLVVSVRSGAPVSMPGMMDTVLDVGLNPTTVRGLVRMSGNPRLAWDCYRRLTQSYGEVVRGIAPERFERIVRRRVEADGLDTARDLDTAALRDVTHESLELVNGLGGGLPPDPLRQVEEAVEAVLRSWHSDRAVEYRRLNGVGDEMGTAVIVQAMVFGNAGGTSGSGVGFTRNPATGDPELWVDFLFNAQGEDVVAGRDRVLDVGRLRRVAATTHAELARSRPLLEREFGDVQDFEFTVEDGRLFWLQTREAKRTPWAALRVAVDLVDEGMIDRDAALARLAGVDVESIERVRIRSVEASRPLVSATPASLGVAVGVIALDADRARERAKAGQPVILVRPAASTADLAGLAVAEGLLTGGGGRTCHAAVVARELGKVCLVGCPDLHVDFGSRTCSIGDRSFAEGERLTLDGETGGVHAGELEVVRERPEEALARVRSWRSGRR